VVVFGLCGLVVWGVGRVFLVGWGGGGWGCGVFEGGLCGGSFSGGVSVFGPPLGVGCSFGGGGGGWWGGLGWGWVWRII